MFKSIRGSAIFKATSKNNAYIHKKHRRWMAVFPKHSVYPD